MQFDIQSGGREWTSTPRDLTAHETASLIEAIKLGRPGAMMSSGRLHGIAVYREMTSATLPVAVRFVDDLIKAEGIQP